MLVLVLGLSVPLRAQPPDRQWADSVYRTLNNARLSGRDGLGPLLDSMVVVYAASGDRCRQARVLGWQCEHQVMQGQLDSAMALSQRAQALFSPPCDSLTYMSIQVGLANVLISLEEHDRALKVAEGALARWNDGWPYSTARNGLYTDRAIALAYLGEQARALEAFHDVLDNARREGISGDEADACNNLSALFGMMAAQDHRSPYLDSAAHYNGRALVIAKQMGDDSNIMLVHSNLAALALDRRLYRQALAHLDTGTSYAVRLGDLEAEVVLAGMRHGAYFDLGLLDSAYLHYKHYELLKDSLLNAEKVKAIADVQEKYESEKKARTITQLKVEKLDGELQQAALRRTRNIYLYGGLGVLVLAGGLWNRLRYVRRSRAAIRHEKEISEGLLHNILPEEVADELRAKGHADVREFERATILFTDFKGFTQLTEKLSAADLVAEIDHCFKAFDGLMEKYRIEKIKTIGDAYMAAGGLPDPQHGSPVDVVNAALEMQAFMSSYKAERIAQGRLFFEMRVGIHTGPVIAGIVGVKKFAYDIWGDTVNTASRMESSGAVGEVNISEATHALVKDVPGLTFTPRGKVQAKGKGEMEMYFVGRRPSEG